MSNPDQITTALRNHFDEEGYRIVFWNDEAAAFEKEFEALELDGVRKWSLQEHGPLATKIEVERTHPNEKFLVYAPFAKPHPKDNWLLDIQLYAKEFHADRPSVILTELGLSSAALVGHIEERLSFFDSKDRRDKIGKLVSPRDREADLDLKMLTVLTKASHPTVEAVAFALLAGFGTTYRDISFTNPNRALDEVEKFGLTESLWKFFKRHWGYNNENPKLKDFFIRLTLTHLNEGLSQQSAELPEALQKFVLPAGAGRLNASVFISNWMQSSKRAPLYETLAEEIEVDLGLLASFKDLSYADLQDSDTYECVERQIIETALPDVLNGAESDREKLDELITSRRDRYWCVHSKKSYGNIYTALAAALRLFALRQRYEDGFQFNDATAMWQGYCEDLYRFDQAYRQFFTAAGRVVQGADVLKNELVSAVENLYCNWYLPELATAWGKHVEKELLSDWHVPGVTPQRSFYDTHVQPILKERDTSRAFVIISDAFRYEAAKELCDLINRGDRISAELEVMQSVLPSITRLGMAALLPNKTYSLDDKGAPVLDGKKVESKTTSRQKVLEAREPKSIAVQADELMAMSTKEGRELVKDSRVVYLYHDVVDATGDSKKTEDETFEAVARAVEELKRLVGFIHIRLNGNRILLTADHGFVYQTGGMTVTDKGAWHPGGTVMEEKKRYVIGKNVPDQDGAWKIAANCIFDESDDIDFIVPKGTQRFHFSGGAKFVHGGALLPEIVVPVIRFKGLKGKAAEEGVSKKVDVQLLHSGNKITNSRQRFQFIQTDKVEGKVLARTLKIGFYDKQGTPVSEEITFTFDSVSDDLSARQKESFISLQGSNFSKDEDYYLVMTDAETDAEYQKIPFKISLGIADEFGW